MQQNQYSNVQQNQYSNAQQNQYSNVQPNQLPNQYSNQFPNEYPNSFEEDYMRQQKSEYSPYTPKTNHSLNLKLHQDSCQKLGNPAYYTQPNYQHNLSYQPSLLDIACDSYNKGYATIKVFKEVRLRIKQKIIPSIATYDGMIDSLNLLKTETIPYPCILCPVYKRSIGGDTQCGFGGKAVFYDEHKMHKETPYDAAKAVMAQKVQIGANMIYQVLVNKRRKTRTSIFAVNANTCSTISNKSSDPNNRVKRGCHENSNEKVAVLIYGSLEDCLKLLDDMSQTTNHDNTLIDNIIGVSIVPLNVAFKLATLALTTRNVYNVQNASK